MSEETKFWDLGSGSEYVVLLTTFVYRRPPHTGQTGARADHSKSGKPAGLSFELAVNQRQNGKKYEHSTFVPEQTAWAEFLSFSTLFQYDRPIFPQKSQLPYNFCIGVNFANS